MRILHEAKNRIIGRNLGPNKSLQPTLKPLRGYSGAERCR